MKKYNHPTLTNYLAKTKKNVDLYRLYNPQLSVFSKTVIEEQGFYFLFLQTYDYREEYLNSLFYPYLSLPQCKQERNNKNIRSFSQEGKP